MNPKLELPNMKQFACLILFAVTLGSRSVASQDTVVIGGTVSIPPMIDATNVINNSLNFNIATSLPWDTSNTRNFTNNGTMNGGVGFRFDTAPRDSGGSPTAPRKLSANFVNQLNGIVTAQDSFLANGFYQGSYLWVNATNIVSKGILQAGGAGDVQITGTNVTLARSGIGINPITPNGSVNDPDNGRFFPDVAINDLYWGQTNMTLNSSTIATFDPATGGLLSVSAPPHRVTFPGGGTGFRAFTLNGGVYQAYTNNVEPPVTLTVTNMDGSTTDVVIFTNIIRQLAVVGFTDTNFEANITFSPSSVPTNFMRTVHVELSMPEFDVITAQPSVSTLYFEDTLASETDRGVLRNVETGLNTPNPIPTSRPANYLLSRVVQGAGELGNAVVDTNFFYGPAFTNRFVFAEYAGYGAEVDYLSSRPPAIPAGVPTNYPGRLAINADSLDLTKTRMRAEGLLTVNARHLVGSSNAVADSTILNYNLGSTNGNLVMQNLMTETVARLHGDIYAWSGRWSNSFSLITTNYDASTNPVVLAPLTNVVTVQFHVLLLNADILANLVPVDVYQLKLHSTNVVIKDNGVVSQNFLVDGRSFTLDGRLTLSSPLESWTYLLAPTLRYFTNTGTLNIPSEAHFGDDGPTNYLTFVNRGTIQSQGQTIYSDYCELNGTNSASAFSVLARDGKVEAGEVDASVSIAFTAGTLKFNAAAINSGGPLFLTVSNALFDNGPASGNVVSFRDGCVLEPKPATGDLLGTSFLSVAPQFAQVEHYWSAQDRGASRQGYTNNVALGRLTPTPEGFDPLFYFAGTGASNALYVDLLDLSQLSDFTNQLVIAPNLVIYYAAAQIGFAPPVGQTTEEFLNGQFEGRLRWVSDYAGANSSVDVVINGNQTIKVNKALRNSTTIDSDADGIPNFSDPTPFDGVMFSSISRTNSPAGYLLTWPSAAGTVYRLEYKTNLTGAPWMLATTVTNNWPTNGPLTVLDITGAPATAQRYYRVTYNPNGP